MVKKRYTAPYLPLYTAFRKEKWYSHSVLRLYAFSYYVRDFFNIITLIFALFSFII